MEITLSKIASKKSLAVLMAFLIAMSTMWTGLAVVSFERLLTQSATIMIMSQRGYRLVLAHFYLLGSCLYRGVNYEK